MRCAADAVDLLAEPDGQRHAQRIGVFECDGALDTHHFGREMDVVVVRTHQVAQQFERLHIAAAEGDDRLVVRHQFVARTRAAHGIQIHFAGCDIALPIFGIADQRTVVVRNESLGHRQHGRCVRNVGKHPLHKPVYAETVYAADDHIGPFQCFFQLLDVKIFHARRERLVELRMLARPFRFGDDLLVQMRTGKPHVVSVLPGGKGQCRTHHAGADDCDIAHIGKI